MKIFETVADMKLAKLTAGQIVKTKGKVTTNDGLGAEYLISAPVTVDEVNDFALANGNVALAKSKDVIYVESYDELRNKNIAGQVVIFSDEGEGGVFLYDSTDVLSVDNGYDVIVDTSGKRWKRYIGKHNPLHNYADNSNFYIFDRGTPVSTTGSADKYVCARWRIKKTNAADVVDAAINDANGGGLKLTITAGASEFIYVRQLLPNLTRFSEKKLTVVVDVENDTSGLEYDWYILTRYNDSDVEREVVVDSDSQPIPVGRNKVALRITVPDIYAQVWTLGSKNSLETAFRIITAGGAVTAANVIVHSFHVLDGWVDESIAASMNLANSKDIYEEEATALYYYEDTGFISLNGLNNSGRQRVQIPMASRKRLGVSGTYTVYDAVGNAGKISTYDSAGARTDNVTPLALTPRKNSFEVIYTSAGSTGIGAQVIADCEF